MVARPRDEGGAPAWAISSARSAAVAGREARSAPKAITSGGVVVILRLAFSSSGAAGAHRCHATVTAAGSRRGQISSKAETARNDPRQ